VHCTQCSGLGVVPTLELGPVDNRRVISFKSKEDEAASRVEAAEGDLNKVNVVAYCVLPAPPTAGSYDDRRGSRTGIRRNGHTFLKTSRPDAR